MPEVALAFLWHQHQPYYPDDLSGDNPMPWVRLHGVKDYYGMALHLLEFPEMRCTINLVPSLLLQLQGYTERGASDRPFAVSRVPADGLTEEQCLYLLDTCFMANTDHMVRPYPRYFDLFQRRGEFRYGLLGGQPLVGRRLLGEVTAPLPSGLGGRRLRLGHHAGDHAREHLGEQPVPSLPRRPVPAGGPVRHGGPAGSLPGLRLPCRQARAYEPIEVEARGVGMQPSPVSDVPHPEWAARRPQQIENPCAALPELSTGVGCD